MSGRRSNEVYQDMTAKELPAQSVLLKLLCYDPESGALTWLERDESACQKRTSFNKKHAGQPAFTAIDQGYLQGKIHKVKYKAHRVIWKLVTGEEPQIIDHINGNREDNRWCNLRSVSIAENMRNLKPRKGTKNPWPGVSELRPGVWSATIIHDYNTMRLGTFKSLAAAISARQCAERELGHSVVM